MMPKAYTSAAGDSLPRRSSSGAVWLRVPAVEVVRWLRASVNRRARPKSLT